MGRKLNVVCLPFENNAIRFIPVCVRHLLPAPVNANYAEIKYDAEENVLLSALLKHCTSCGWKALWLFFLSLE